MRQRMLSIIWVRKGCHWSRQVEGGTGESIRNLGNMGGGHNNQQLTTVPCQIVAQPFWGVQVLFGMLWDRDTGAEKFTSPPVQCLITELQIKIAHFKLSCTLG